MGYRTETSGVIPADGETLSQIMGRKGRQEQEYSGVSHLYRTRGSALPRVGRKKTKPSKQNQMKGWGGGAEGIQIHKHEGNHQRHCHQPSPWKVSLSTPSQKQARK